MNTKRELDQIRNHHARPEVTKTLTSVSENEILRSLKYLHLLEFRILSYTTQGVVAAPGRH
jgi:hypothetical protein